jgi:hypothetical protein
MGSREASRGFGSDYGRLTSEVLCVVLHRKKQAQVHGIASAIMS